jgi:hypothetical protein
MWRRHARRYTMWGHARRYTMWRRYTRRYAMWRHARRYARWRSPGPQPLLLLLLLLVVELQGQVGSCMAVSRYTRH